MNVGLQLNRFQKLSLAVMTDGNQQNIPTQRVRPALDKTLDAV